MPEGLPLDLDALLAPISEEQPGGSNLFLSLKGQLDELRREVLPEPDVPEEDVKVADWRGLEARTRDILARQCKDIRVSLYLVLALIKLYGYAGLDQGLQLLTGLYDRCWDYLYPVIDPEDNDLSPRSDPLENMLDSADKGLLIPSVLRQTTLVWGADGTFSYLDWPTVKKGVSEEEREAFDKAVRSTSTEKAREQVNAIAACLEDLQTFRALLQTRFGHDAPALVHLRDAIDDGKKLADYILQVVEPSGPAQEHETNTLVEGGASPGAVATGGPARTRGDIYRQLRQLADALQYQEPHSPVPYLIRRAVQLGDMAFPELLKTLVRDLNVLTELNRELGIPGEEASS